MHRVYCSAASVQHRFHGVLLCLGNVEAPSMMGVRPSVRGCIEKRSRRRGSK